MVEMLNGEAKKLAERCAMGDVAAMLKLSQWFRGKLSSLFISHEKEWEQDTKGKCRKEMEAYLDQNQEEGFYMKASNMWLFRARLYGSAEAAEILRQHPLYEQNGYFDRRMFLRGRDREVKAEGRELRCLGLLDFEKDEPYFLKGINRIGRYRADVLVDYCAADEYGFGMEELYDKYVFDEFFNLLSFAEKKDSSWHGGEVEGREDKRELYWKEHGCDVGAEKYHADILRTRGFIIDDGILKDCLEDCRADVFIPEHVTAIGEGAFGYCEKLSGVVIPKGVKTIGNGAFEGCNHMKGIIIPEGVESIGGKAFRRCSNLKKIELPGSLKEIGENAFEDCWKLEEVIFSEGIHAIGGGVFSSCQSLRKVVIPASMNEIDCWSFCDCHMLEIWGNPGTYAEEFAKSRLKPIPFHDI